MFALGGVRATRTVATTTTDTRGTFTFNGLVPGDFEVEVVADGSVGATSVPRTLSEGAMVLSDVVVPPPTQRVTLRSFAELRTRLQPGTTVSVIDTSGNELNGEVLDISSSSLALRVDDDRRDLLETTVRQVDRRAGLGARVGPLSDW